MDALAMKLPPGYKFFPNDQEIISFYLLNKIIKNSFPEGLIDDTVMDDCDDALD